MNETRELLSDDGTMVDVSPDGRFVPLGHSCGLIFVDGEDRPRFRHVCDRGRRGVLICAPSLHPDHVVTESQSGVTVRASILCSDCHIHGYVTDSAWEPA